MTDNDQRKQFESQGYLIKRDFFKDSDIGPVYRDIELEGNKLVHQLYEKGLLTKDYSIDETLDLDTKILLAEKEYKGTTILLHTAFASRLKESFGNLFSNGRLLDLIETLLGSKEISGHPEWNLRCKTPNNRYFDVPFHQDAAYLEVGAEFFKQITVWIPLVDIVLENGPLQLFPPPIGSVATTPLCKHHLQKNLDPSFKDSWYLEIKETDLPLNSADVLTITPLSKGSIVLFPNCAIHKSLPNHSKSIRWTVDLRFMKTSDPSGFYPIDASENETKMKLRSSILPEIPIDYKQWALDNQNILMDMDDKKDKNDFSIQGPWMNRWK
ncbi:hypothetical protein CYY_009144 [Polysphondylium violaceum]|uniref:Phytanoyl-CoA dioxygenase n=1 Tax=Polysphondylium violaceum TaxID=133409 RepID=A0A8J4PU48_9MYCE|nr:hypothetical protein CYY_009144 [Polysphondylium violaceum]